MCDADLVILGVGGQHRKAVKHRGDIQGMRAVAVLLVVLGHAGVPGLGGGYIGVDVFFVVSGFLITGILVREVERTGRVSIAAFYARRARRILPAASVVLLVVVVVSSQLFSRLRVDGVMTDVTWATFFAANVHSALSGADYFATTSFVSPVEHFWSLAVEEQFYLVWPLLVALIVFTRRKTGPGTLAIAIGLLCGLSLVWSVWRTGSDPAAAYYSTPARAWELGAGALLAIGTTWVSRLPVTVKFIASWTGLVAIAAAAATYTSETPFPGYHALLPVTGAVLVLAGGTEGPRYGAALVLDRLPMRWIGDVSYSLYLWHWPLLVVPAMYLGRDLEPVERLALIASAVAVSALSYWLVETPVRRAAFLSRHRIRALAMWPATAAILSAAVIVVPGLHEEPAAAAPYVAPRVDPEPRTAQRSSDPAVNSIGFAAELARAGHPLPPALRPSLDQLWYDVSRPPEQCGSDRDDIEHEICRLGNTGASRKIVLFGDSHIAMWLEPLLRIAESRGWQIIPFLKASCFPADVTEWRHEKRRPYTECDTWRDWAYGEIAKIKPERIIISGSIDQTFVDASGKPIPVENSAAVFADGVRSTLRKLRQYSPKVHVISGTPILTKEPAECLANRKATMGSCAGPLNSLVEQRNRIWQQATRATGTHWIDAMQWFCDKRTCPLVVGNVIVYRDTNHITKTYADTLRNALARRLGL